MLGLTSLTQATFLVNEAWFICKFFDYALSNPYTLHFPSLQDSQIPSTGILIGIGSMGCQAIEKALAEDSLYDRFERIWYVDMHESQKMLPIEIDHLFLNTKSLDEREEEISLVELIAVNAKFFENLIFGNCQEAFFVSDAKNSISQAILRSFERICESRGIKMVCVLEYPI